MIKLIDFRSSILFEENPANPSGPLIRKEILDEEMRFGTSYYVAPEVFLSDYDSKCDMWSLGCILYTLLAGIVPFDGKNDKEIIRKVRWGEYNLDVTELRNVSSDAKDLIK